MKRLGYFISWFHFMSEYFPKQKSSGANVKVASDLSNYATIS